MPYFILHILEEYIEEYRRGYDIEIIVVICSKSGKEGINMDLIEKASTLLVGSGKRVVFTESTDQRILEAAQILREHQICIPILVGEKEEVEEAAKRYEISLDGIEIKSPSDEIFRQQVVEGSYSKLGIWTEKTLLRKSKNSLNLGALMVTAGFADCLASGVINSTGDVLLSAQQFIGLKEGIKTPSSIGFQVLPSFDGEETTQVVGVADCAVCLSPTASELADIAISSAESYSKIMHTEARVALLSYSTLGSAKGEAVDKVCEAVKLVKSRRPELLVEGEFQIDSALVPQIAQRKVSIESKVAGKANVLIFPDLNAGNIAVKCMQMFGKGSSYGPLLQGFKKQVTDFSRAATVTDVVGNVTLCLMQGI